MRLYQGGRNRKVDVTISIDRDLYLKLSKLQIDISEMCNTLLRKNLHIENRVSPLNTVYKNIEVLYSKGTPLEDMTEVLYNVYSGRVSEESINVQIRKFRRVNRQIFNE